MSDVGDEPWERALAAAMQRDCDVPPDEWRSFLDAVYPQSFQRGELLVTEGRPIDRVYLLLQGIVRYFARGVDREVTFGFDYEGRLSSDVEGFFRATAARISLEALEQVDTVVIPRCALTAGYERHPCWDRVGRLLLQDLLVRRDDKERRIRMLTAEERYRLLIEQGSPLATRLPQYHLAAYLGIAPETLSRIRARF